MSDNGNWELAQKKGANFAVQEVCHLLHSTNLASHTTRKSVKSRVAIYLNTMIVAMFMMVMRMIMMMVVVMRSMVICSPEFGVWGVLE